MTTIEVEQEQETYTPDPELDGPMKAHIVWGRNSLQALCGKRLLGYPAPEDMPRCKECKELYDSIMEMTA